MAKGCRYTRAGPTPARRKTWLILLFTSMALSVITCWVFSAVLEGLLFGCPVGQAAYCSKYWHPIMNQTFWAFCGLMPASVLFLIVTLILRCTPWYKGARIAQLKEFEDVPEYAESNTYEGEKRYRNDIAKR